MRPKASAARVETSSVKNSTVRSGAESCLDARHRGEHTRGRERKDPAQRRARAHQKQALAKQLAEDGGPSCAYGEAQAELPLPHRVARLHHHGHIGASDQENQDDQAHENPKRLTVLIVIAANAARGHKLQQRLPLLGIDCADGLLNDLGIRAGDRLLRLHRRNAGVQPRHHAQAPPIWGTIERIVVGGCSPCV